MRSLSVTIALAGCFSPAPHAGVLCSPTGECPSGLVCSPASNTCEPSAIDPDAMVIHDGAVLDTPPSDGAAIDAPPMPVVVARYLFDEDLLDQEGDHDATAVGTELAYSNGRNGDGDRAVRVPASLSSYVRIPDSPAFDIPAGSIELWYRYDGTAPAGDLGLFSRDAVGTTTNGHINLRVGHDRRLVLRIQRMSSPTVDAYRCTLLPQQVNTWHHVLITFGGTLTMEVDGVVTQGTTWTETDGDVRSCTAAWTGGIDGNDNPWIVGALTALATEGTGAPVQSIAGGVQIDELVIRRNP